MRPPPACNHTRDGASVAPLAHHCVSTAKLNLSRTLNRSRQGPRGRPRPAVPPIAGQLQLLCCRARVPLPLVKERQDCGSCEPWSGLHHLVGSRGAHSVKRASLLQVGGRRGWVSGAGRGEGSTQSRCDERGRGGHPREGRRQAHTACPFQSRKSLRDPLQATSQTCCAHLRLRMVNIISQAGGGICGARRTLLPGGSLFELMTELQVRPASLRTSQSTMA